MMKKKILFVLVVFVLLCGFAEAEEILKQDCGHTVKSLS